MAVVIEYIVAHAPGPPKVARISLRPESTTAQAVRDAEDLPDLAGRCVRIVNERFDTSRTIVWRRCGASCPFPECRSNRP